MNQIFLMGLIANRGLRKKYLAFFEEHHITVVLSTMAAGTASNTILDALGLEATEKTVYFALLTRDTWKSLKKELYEKMNIAVPGRGIAFLIPLSSIGGRKTLQYLTAGQTMEIEEESTLQNTDYELLVTIANGGHIETIMDAARSANAPGGTVIHAKGTGFLGISLAEEKEMIFIVVKTSQKQAIMKSIMERAGIGSPAGGIVFSLPVTSTAGLRLLEETEL